MLLQRTVGLAVRGWWTTKRAVLDTIPRPTDEPRVSAPGERTARILLVGNGPVAGFGVASHSVALPGHIARQVAAITDRGVELQLITDLELTVSNAEGHYAEQRDGAYDLVICMIGTVDAAYQTPVADWRKHITRLCGSMAEHSPDAQLLLVGIPGSKALRLVPGITAAAMDARAREYDAVGAHLAATLPRTHFLPFAPPTEPDADRHRSSATYRAWAVLIAPEAARLLSLGSTS